ncbi:probable helicase with zinc finger domain [Octopus bimaculoides]|nr:probable helicase with zinc finger domain [Octopus bimaculoides]|eukprot:XP_014788960.1 PREDICTED: probable helicase with zinc finger domain [Octopus bimaculoides]
MSGQSSENTLYCNSNSQHLWENSKILQHTLDLTFTLIRKPSSSKNKDYKLCQTLKCKKDNCIYAHSMVERDVWMVLRDQNVSMEDFVSYCKAAKTKPPYMLNEFCRICYSTGKMLTHSQCQHDKIHGSIYTTKTNERRIINHLPSVIPSKYNFLMCNSAKNNKCTKRSFIECTFAHNDEEIVIWKWMCNNNVKTLEEYVRLQNQCHPKLKCGNSLNSNETKVTKKENINIPSVSLNRFKELGGYSSIVNKLPVSRENPKLTHDINGTRGNACLDSSPVRAKSEKIPESSTNQIKPILVECCSTISKPLYQMLPDIKITMNMTSALSSESKKSPYQWCFDIFSKKHNLQKIKILTKKIGENFFLIPTAKANDSNPAYLNMFKIAEDKWQVPVIYTGDACETFSVNVVFDFGIKYLLSYPIDVKISPAENTKDVKTCLKASTNTQLNATNPVDLMTKYKIPENLVLNEHNTELTLKKDNYVETMHTLLYAEEIARNTIISRYNFRSEMKISNYINDASGTFFTDVDGSLFGIVNFSASLLCGDQDNLVSKNCESVLLFLTSNKNKFYEIPITMKTNPPFSGLQQSTLYLTFNKQHVINLKLENGNSLDVEIHFKLNRKGFLRMHHAIDSLISTEIVFPNTCTIPLENENQDYSDTHLNEDQLFAVKHIPCKCTDARPPFVIIGSFGTGKTETLFSSITKIVENNSTAKILICTHTNGAADMFIIKQLHKFLSRNKKTLYLKRLYHDKRRWETIDPVVQKYVIFPSKNQLKSDMVDPQSMQILVTTMEMCHCLMTMEIQGCFSHIFVDEAAQVFESMVLIPLSLASEKTCVVLCGDPNQLGPEVHSTNVAKDLLSISIVKRLFEYYRKQGKKNKVMQHPPYIFLKQNYRSCKEIVNFLAYSFYGLSHEMTSKVENPVSDMKALQFYSVEGTAETLPQNMSYYNKMEAEKVRTIVKDVMKSWPDEEEKLLPEEICVVSNEQNQVKLIREYLLRERININNVISVQGKQYKVVIISTVHTPSSLCNEAEYTNFLNNKLLLNTAMSRAKYVVIAVGDPVTLCISGECKYIWQHFIQNCSELNTLYPADYTYDVIHSKIISALNNISQEEYTTETYDDEMEADPNINDCIKHHEFPQECFPLLYTESSDNLKRPIIDAICQEALCTALATPLVMFVDVNIKWDQNQGYGEFCIKSSILKAKNIELHSIQSMTNIPDWFCIKYKGHQASKSDISKTSDTATYFVHVWILEVKNEYDNLVVKIRVIDSEVDTLNEITDDLSCSMWLISFDNFYRFLISSLIAMDTISPFIKIYVNEFHKIPNKLVEQIFPEQIEKYEYPTNGVRISELVKWLSLASNDDRMKTEKYQIIVCSKEDSTLDAIANQLKIQQILKNCIMRVADEKTEDNYFEKYWQLNVTINSQDDLTYLHEHLLWKNSLFQNYMATVKELKATGIDVSLETNKFKENILANSHIIFCNIVTTIRMLFKKLNKKKMIVIADAANHTEMPVVLPLLLNNIQGVFLFTTP